MLTFNKIGPVLSSTNFDASFIERIFYFETIIKLKDLTEIGLGKFLEYLKNAEYSQSRLFY